MEKTVVPATSGGFNDEIAVYHDNKRDNVHLSVTEYNDGGLGRNVAVWLTPKETDDLIVVLQYALSVMEDTNGVS